MYIDLTDAQKALRDELRDYFAKLITPELRPQLRGMESGDLYKQVVQQMGSDGWLGVGWPEAYGGRGLVPSSSSSGSTRRAGPALRFPS